MSDYIRDVPDDEGNLVARDQDGVIVGELTYEVQQGSSPISGSIGGWASWWSVVERLNGQATGGDAHWVEKEFAAAAKECYEDAVLVHGQLTEADRRFIVGRAKARGWVAS